MFRRRTLNCFSHLSQLISTKASERFCSCTIILVLVLTGAIDLLMSQLQTAVIYGMHETCIPFHKEPTIPPKRRRKGIIYRQKNKINRKTWRKVRKKRKNADYNFQYLAQNYKVCHQNKYRIDSQLS